jgi:hypothetical protein
VNSEHRSLIHCEEPGLLNLAAQKPLLTICMKAKSLSFAKAYEHLTSVDENAP